MGHLKSHLKKQYMTDSRQGWILPGYGGKLAMIPVAALLLTCGSSLTKADTIPPLPEPKVALTGGHLPSNHQPLHYPPHLDQKIPQAMHLQKPVTPRQRDAVPLRGPRQVPTTFSPPSTKPLDTWPDDLIAKERSACERLLKGRQIRYEVIKPFRRGRCGAAAPVSFQGIDGRSLTRIVPAAKLNCRMAAAVHHWLSRYVQPSAEHYLNSPVVKLRNVASYSCRNRYNDPSKKISEHALANALDIASFTFANGDVITVLDHWRDEGPKGKFLRSIHKAACKTFKVVLGPHANKAHENHFHFDLGRWPVCE